MPRARSSPVSYTHLVATLGCILPSCLFVTALAWIYVKSVSYTQLHDEARRRVLELSETYDLRIDPDKKVKEISLPMQGCV